MHQHRRMKSRRHEKRRRFFVPAGGTACAGAFFHLRIGCERGFATVKIMDET